MLRLSSNTCFCTDLDHPPHNKFKFFSNSYPQKNYMTGTFLFLHMPYRHTSFFASSHRWKLIWELYGPPEFRCEPLNGLLWSATPARR